MSESQFAYSGFTLDELRSLAASPQVGTMQAMPQSFRALADRVGEVADLLSHAQADLPNWWKGPAAEQAAATLGRAAAEAREFHGSALVAASAVSRCAQVVAAQQSQMMDVPDVQEPGITDVVQRPATPFEALEAARQDASYQAAHEQAVQVVNGIAAQYVETRSQLSNIGIKFGENFAPVETTPQPSVIAESPAGSHSRLTEQESLENIEGLPLEGNQLSMLNRNRRSTSPQPPSRPKEYRIPTSGFASHDTARSGLAPSNLPAPHRTLETTSVTENSKLEAGGPPPPAEEMPPTTAVNNCTEADSHRQIPANKADYEPSTDRRIYRPSLPSNVKRLNQAARIPGDETQGNEGRVNRLSNTASDNFPATEGPEHQSQPGGGGNENAAIIPPYASVGPVHRTREERKPRPAYLKERKSSWIPEVFAAPADGVIDPEWFEQY